MLPSCDCDVESAKWDNLGNMLECRRYYCQAEDGVDLSARWKTRKSDKVPDRAADIWAPNRVTPYKSFD